MPATREEVATSLGYALCYNRSDKPHRLTADAMSRIAADVLTEHLELSGFVILKKPPARMASYPPPNASTKLTD